MSKDENAVSAAVSENAPEQTGGVPDSATQKQDQNESQFQKIGEIVERDEDTGLVQVESLCMNCHENVCSTAQSFPTELMLTIRAGYHQAPIAPRPVFPRYHSGIF